MKVDGAKRVRGAQLFDKRFGCPFDLIQERRCRAAGIDQEGDRERAIDITEMSNRLLLTILVDAEVTLVQIHDILTLAIDDGDWDRNEICIDAEDIAAPYLLLFLHCHGRLTVSRARNAG